MAAPINSEEIVQSLQSVIDSLGQVEKYARDAAVTINKIVFVSCGSGFQAAKVIEFWRPTLATNVDIHVYHASEFAQLNAPDVDAHTLVVLISKSGRTLETIAAIKRLNLKSYAAKMVITQTTKNALVSAAGQDAIVFTLGERTKETLLAIAMILWTVVGAVFSTKENWSDFEDLKSSLHALPSAFANAAETFDATAKTWAKEYSKADHWYLAAHGPMMFNANVLGLCILTESLKIHTHPVDAAEVPHGVGEVWTHGVPILLFRGEDPTARQHDRLINYLNTKGIHHMAIDTRNFVMEGIHRNIRPLFAPLLAQAAGKRVSAHLLALLNVDPLVRTCVGKIDLEGNLRN